MAPRMNHAKDSSRWSLDSMQQSAASPFGDHQNTTGAAPRNDGRSTSWAASSATKRRRSDDATPTSSFSMIVSQEEEELDYSEEEGFSCSNKRLKQRGAPADRVGGGTETSASWPMPHVTAGGTSGNGNINNTQSWSQEEEEEKPQEMQREEALVWWKQKPRVVIPTNSNNNNNNNGNHRHGPACGGDINNNHRNHQGDRCFVCWRPYEIEEKVVPRLTVSMTPNALLNYFRPKQQQQQRQPLLSATNLGGTARGGAAAARQHQEQKRQVVLRCCCTYCERSPVCPDCMRDCEDCLEPFCSFCTTTDYDRGRQERILCLECAAGRAYRDNDNDNGNHGCCRHEQEDDDDGDATMHVC